MEHWKAISDIEGGWLVSDKGNLKVPAYEKIFYVKGKKQSKFIPTRKYGLKDYSNMTFNVGTQTKPCFYNVAELVANAFVSNPKQFKYLYYIDGNKQNIQAENLKWVEKEYGKGDTIMGLKEFFGFKSKVKSVNLPNTEIAVLDELESEAKRFKTSSKKHIGLLRSKKVICKETGKKFNSITDAAKAYKLNRNGVYSAMRAGRSINGYTFCVDNGKISTVTKSEEQWMPAKGYEAFFEVSNTEKFRRLTKRGYSNLKISYKKNGKAYASTTINNKYKTLNVTDIMNATFSEKSNSKSSSNIKASFEVIKVKETVSEEISFILKHWDTISEEQIKDRLNLVMIMCKEQESKTNDILSSIKDIVDKAVKSSETQVDETELKTFDEIKEVWKTSYLSDKYQVSSLGRYRRKLSVAEAKKKGDKYIYSNGIVQGGHRMFSFQINGKQKVVNAARVILNSFNRTKFNNRVVYLNGDVMDIRLSNLAWKK